jgi:hypothetical protein
MIKNYYKRERENNKISTAKERENNKKSIVKENWFLQFT